MEMAKKARGPGDANRQWGLHLSVVHLDLFIPVADLRGGARDARPPLGAKILSFSCSFRPKK